MEKEYLIKEANEFLEKNEYVCWTPQTFPEDMENGDILGTLVDEGDAMFDELLRAKDLISLLLFELS